MSETMNEQASNLAAVNRLYTLMSILQNMNLNIGLIQQGTIGKVLTVTNANLFQIAAQEYGDATQWTTIANANGLIDPMIESTIGASLSTSIDNTNVITLSGIPVSPQSITFKVNSINYTYNVATTDTLNNIATNMARLINNARAILNTIIFQQEDVVSPDIFIERIVNLVIPQQIGLQSGGILAS